MKFSFSKELRLLTPSSFTYVFQQPKQISMFQITILSRLNLLGRPRIGLSISKKHIKHAHERNRIKRLIRESFRLFQHELPSIDFVVTTKYGIDNFSNRALAETLEKLWHYHCHVSPKS